MDPKRRRLVWLLFRLTAYVVVLVLLFQARNSVDWRHLFSRTRTEGAPPNTLTIAGIEQAPGLLGGLITAYRHDYPRVQVMREPGGTVQALELLVNRGCDVAFTLRPVSYSEQQIFRQATGDTAVVNRIALGGLLLIGAVGNTQQVLSRSEVRQLALVGSIDRIDRLYAPDPNSGLWAAFLECLAPESPDSARGAGVIYLADEAAVIEAVRHDPRSIGLASSLSLPESLVSRGVQPLALAGDTSGNAPVAPTYETIGNAHYPLVHYLHAVSRPGGGLEGNMFVTHLTSSRGQRQIERAGYLPSRQALRSILLTTDPIGNPK